MFVAGVFIHKELVFLFIIVVAVEIRPPLFIYAQLCSDVCRMRYQVKFIYAQLCSDVCRMRYQVNGRRVSIQRCTVAHDCGGLTPAPCTPAVFFMVYS